MCRALPTERIYGRRGTLGGSKQILSFRTLSRRRGIAFGACKGGVGDDKIMAAAELVSYLRRVLRFCCTRAKGDGGDPTTVVKVKSPAHTAFF